MKTQRISAVELLGIIEEKDCRITELEQQNQWLIEQFRLLKRITYLMTMYNSSSSYEKV